MPAVSQKQQKLMGIVHGIQKGTVNPSNVSKKAQQLAKKMKPSSAADYASTKRTGLPKKVKNEEIEGHLGQVFAVQLPYDGCSPQTMIHQVDPLVGLGGSEIVPDQIHSVHADQDMANSVAQTLYEEYCAKQEMLEEKKGMTVNKIRRAIDKLEKQRKSHIDMAKENPKEASSHKEEIARLATKIDDLISKMGMIEKSKKEQDNKEDKQK